MQCSAQNERRYLILTPAEHPVSVENLGKAVTFSEQKVAALRLLEGKIII
jgi:hypothetical protein